MKKDSIKGLIIKIIYVLFWSVSLLFATFPLFFMGEMKFDFQNDLKPEALLSYIFPFIMSMVIFLLDVIYGFIIEGRREQYKNIVPSLVFVTLYLLCFIFSLYMGKWIFFLSGWLCLTMLKMIKTEDLPDSVTYPKGRIVLE